MVFDNEDFFFLYGFFFVGEVPPLIVTLPPLVPSAEAVNGAGFFFGLLGFTLGTFVFNAGLLGLYGRFVNAIYIAPIIYYLAL
jgi:hypothetical protein